MAGEVKSFPARTWWVLPGIVLFYLTIAVGQALVKLVWADELITFYIAQQPGWAGVWGALAGGADPNPPLIHILVQASTGLFGSGALAIRLPAILCVLLAIVAIWMMLRRWVSPVFAATGVLAFMATRGFDYSYDARSYAPMMAFAMLSLALWMKTGDWAGWRRVLAIAGMALALAGGISSNYYCVLAFFPIALGELLRAWKHRRLPMGVWLGLFAGALPLLAYLPLIRHNIAEFGPHAWNRPRLSMVGLSYVELVEGVFWPVLAMGLYALWKRRTDWKIAAPETAAIAVLLLYPVLGFLIAICGAGLISPRCVAPVCCGFGMAAALLGQHLFGKKPRLAAGMLVLFIVWVTVREGFCASLLLEQRRSFLTLRGRVASEPNEPILVGDSSFVLPLYFYSSDVVRSRIVCPIDFDAIHRYEADDSGEQNLWAGRHGVFPFPIIPFGQVDLRTSSIIVIGRPDGWLAESIRAAGVTLTGDGSESADWNRAWYGVGGVFTPMAHPATRILLGGVGPQ